MIWTTLKGKSGNLCRPAQHGELHCPLIIRESSEDVISSTTFTLLRYLPAFRWIPDLLNTALKSHEFAPKTHQKLKFGLWTNKPPFPRELVPWREGSTQVDFQLTYENPPTTVYVEAKYASPLTRRVSNDDGSSGYPSDQLIRNARVGLLECGYYADDPLFKPLPPRQFYLILFAPKRGNPLVRRYRNPEILRKSIPNPQRLRSWPQGPFVGELSYRDVQGILKRMYEFLSPGEQIVARDLHLYLGHKLDHLPHHSRLRQGSLELDAGESH